MRNRFASITNLTQITRCLAVNKHSYPNKRSYAEKPESPSRSTPIVASESRSPSLEDAITGDDGCWTLIGTCANQICSKAICVYHKALWLRRILTNRLRQVKKFPKR